jgi:hypothetical protein
LVLKPGLQATPAWECATKEDFARGGEFEDPMTAVFAAMALDPSPAEHGVEGAGEGGAVDGKDVTELLLVDRPGERDRLQDGELGSAQTGGAESFVVEQCEGSGCASKGGTGARESGNGGLVHVI